MGRSVRPGAADQQGVAGEDPVLHHQAHRIAGMAGRVQRLQPQLADDQHVAVVQPHVGIGRGAQPVRHHRRVQRAASSRLAEKWSAWVWVSTT